MAAGWNLGTGVLVLFLGMFGRVAPIDPVQGEDARDAYLAELVAHAAWCAEEDLYLERTLVLERVLTVDPDHAEVRKLLGHKHQRDGSWSELRSPTRPKNRGKPEALTEAERRLVEIQARYLDHLTDQLFDRAATHESAREIEEEILRLDPEHTVVHVLRGEVLHEGRWILRETGAARHRRARMADRLADLLAAVPAPEERVLAASDTPLGLEFHEARSPGFCVRATSGPEEALQIHRTLPVLRDLFTELFGVAVTLPEGCTVYALDGDAARGAFLAGHPGLDAGQRDALERLDGTQVPGTFDWAWWTPDEQSRLDGIARIALSAFVLEAFDVDLRHAWLVEGIGLWATGAVLGTRLSWFVNPESEIDPREAYAFRSHLLEPGVDWLIEAKKALEARGAPDPVRLLAKSVSELSVDELLYSHALVAYLVEARGEDAPLLFEAIGRGQDLESAWMDTLGAPLDEVTARLPRWLAECAELERKEKKVVDDGALLAAWSGLDAAKKQEVVAALRKSVDELDSFRMRTLRALQAANAELVANARPAEPAEFYDPKVHARAQPIPREWLAADDPRALAVYAETMPPIDERAVRASWRYEWGTGAIVRVGDPDDPETVFANALLGYPPGLDLARALALRGLDRGDERALFHALAHAYTDREGNVYPGITLYDAWDSQLEIEMPDVDALGFVHEFLDDWKTWWAPIPSTEHEELYSMIRGHFERARKYRSLREAVADTLLVSAPSARYGFEGQRTNLHALWAEHDSDPTKLAPVLPGAEERERFIHDWLARCKQEAALWRKGRMRENQLRTDAEAVRERLIDAMEAAGALAADPDSPNR